MSNEMKTCPMCESPYAYEVREDIYSCSECSHEWNIYQVDTEDEIIVKDASGNILQDGDTVVVVKNLPVKGASGPVKSGTKVKNIRLADGDHNIDCKIPGFGAMALKSEFVKKS